MNLFIYSGGEPR